MRRRRTFDYLAVCRQCTDQFTLVVEVTADPNNEGSFIGRVEKSRDLSMPDGEILHEDGLPRHRCGGKLTIYGEGHRVRLVP